jgi:Cu/Ag efflux protein CusF
MRLIHFILLINLLLLGCSKNGNTTEAKSYNIRGEVIEIDSNSSRITLAHHDIPGLMKAMTMPFKVKNPALLNTVFVGDSISGTLVMPETGYYLDSLSVIWKDTTPVR